jgi:hypothetical protein
MSEEGREGFLARWSRRKREAASEPEPEAEPEAAPLALPAADPEPPEAGQPLAEPPTRQSCPIPNLPEVDLASLPPIEELTAESDFSLFLRPGVPSLLRNAALRRMWSLDPAIRDFIGPADYQWDFNTPGGLPLGFADEVGGNLGKLLAQAVGKIEEVAQETEAEPVGASADPPLLPTPPDAEDEPAPVTPGLPEVAAAPEEQPEISPPTPPRRRHGSALPV